MLPADYNSNLKSGLFAAENVKISFYEPILALSKPSFSNSIVRLSPQNF